MHVTLITATLHLQSKYHDLQLFSSFLSNVNTLKIPYFHTPESPFSTFLFTFIYFLFFFSVHSLNLITFWPALSPSFNLTYMHITFSSHYKFFSHNLKLSSHTKTNSLLLCFTSKLWPPPPMLLLLHHHHLHKDHWAWCWRWSQQWCCLPYMGVQGAIGGTMSQNGALVVLFFLCFLQVSSLPSEQLLHLCHHHHQQQEPPFYHLLSLHGCSELEALLGVWGGFWLCSCLFFTGRPQFKNSFGNRTMK